MKTIKLPRYDYHGNFVGADEYSYELRAHSERASLPVNAEIETWGQEYGQPNTVVPAEEAIVGYLQKLPENGHLGTVRKFVRWQLVGQDKPTTWASYHGGSSAPGGREIHFYFGGCGGAFFSLVCKRL